MEQARARARGSKFAINEEHEKLKRLITQRETELKEILAVHKENRRLITKKRRASNRFDVQNGMSLAD